MSEKKHRRRKCPKCHRLNEDRLDTCYYCWEPLSLKWTQKLKRKLKKLLGLP